MACFDLELRVSRLPLRRLLAPRGFASIHLAACFHVLALGLVLSFDHGASDAETPTRRVF